MIVCPRFKIPDDLQTGDVLFTHGNDLSSSWIRYWTRHRKEAPSLTDHQGLIYDKRFNLQFTFLHDTLKYSHELYWQTMALRGDEWVVYRRAHGLSNSTKEELKNLMNEAERKWRYSLYEIMLQFGDNILEKVFGRRLVVLRRLGLLWRKGVVCSTGSNIILREVGLVPDKAVFWSPDDALDLFEVSEDWIVFAQSKGWAKLRERVDDGK